MNELLNQFQSLNQEQGIVVLFASLLIASVGVIALVAVLRSLGKWGIVAALVSLGSVLIAYKVIG